MRIVLSNSSAKWGGVHVVTEVLARSFQARGHEVVVFGYPRSPLEERMRDIAPFEAIGRGMDLSPIAVARAIAALRRHRTEVVLAMMKKDVRHTVPAASMLGIPSIVRYANDRPLRGGIYDRLFFGRLPVAHITNSHATRRTLVESAPWLRHRSVDVIHNGIDTRSFELVAPADLGLPSDAIAIGFVGRLEIRKGVVDLAAAWHSIASRLPKAHLVIAGAGPAEAKVREVLADSPRVHWLGFRRDVPQVMKALDIVAIPSHWEGFGIVAAEALLSGAAVVAANASSLPEIVADHMHGLLVPPRDPAALASAIVELATDSEARTRMTAAGRARVLDEFSAEAMVDRYEEVLSAATRRARYEATLEQIEL
ncbi:MAG TPA: glycosyltransferase family 4 protein [Gemmatimonadaceae bacterium]|nr:glycosyltransferase family 4 protein [Gemmatimonadaceae bacterium]